MKSKWKGSNRREKEELEAHYLNMQISDSDAHGQELYNLLISSSLPLWLKVNIKTLGKKNIKIQARILFHSP